MESSSGVADADTTSGQSDELSGSSERDHEDDLELRLSMVKLVQSADTDPTTIYPGITLSNQNRNYPLELSKLDKLEECTNDDGIKRLNPFKIDLIISNVMQYVPRNSLLKFRLVNRDWNTTAVYWIRQKQEKRREITPGEFPWFCLDFIDCDLFPLSKLTFILDGMYRNRGDHFFTQHGSRILDLKIIDFKFFQPLSCPEKNQQNLTRVQHILKHVPNLEKLSLQLELLPKCLTGEFIYDQEELLTVALTKVTSIRLSARRYLCTKFLNGLFEMCPNVNNMILKLIKGQQQAESVIEAMNKIEFRFHTIYSYPWVERLGLWSAITKSQRLKILAMNPEIGEDVEAQVSMLNSQSECLEVLSLGSTQHSVNRLQNPNIPKLKLPIMKSVRTLILKPWIYGNNNIPDGIRLPMIPIEPYQLPNLHSVKVCPRILELGTFADFAFSSVKTVKIQGQGQNCEQLALMANRFPNLVKLRNLNSNLGTTQMELIATSWANLEILEMKILGGTEQINNFNSVVSGVSLDFEDHHGLASLQSFVGPRRPCLRDLKRLKKLVLTFDCQESNECFRVDEIGVHLTFLHLARNLCLYFKGDFTISTELAALLTAHYQSIFFIPNEQSGI